MDILLELLDRVKIGELLAEYCRALDLMDLAAVAAVFTDDCTVEYGPEPHLRSEGAAALAGDLRRLWRWSRTSHHLSNIQITFDDSSRARAASYVIAWHERPDGSTATLWGQYRDLLVRRPDGWRIAARRQAMNGSDPGFTLKIHPTQRRPPPADWIAPDWESPNVIHEALDEAR